MTIRDDFRRAEPAQRSTASIDTVDDLFVGFDLDDSRFIIIVNKQQQQTKIRTTKIKERSSELTRAIASPSRRTPASDHDVM
jgi:hypothetical protein